MSDKPGIKPEDKYKPSEAARKVIQQGYTNFYEARDERSRAFEQIQGYTLEEYWTESRQLFWNSKITKSEDLEALGLDFSLPFTRKEVMDFVGRLTSMNMVPVIGGDGAGMHAVRLLTALDRKWRTKSIDRVEKFWQLLSGVVNGTTCIYVGFQGTEREFRYLTSIQKDGTPTFETKKVKKWNDVITENVPLEEMYLRKIWERDIQKQGGTIRKQEMTRDQFDAAFPQALYPNAQYVALGTEIAEDSLFHKLLGGSTILTRSKVQVLTIFDTHKDQHIILANGVWLNPVGNDEIRPNPFAHKMQPYVWAQNEAIDDRFAYGLSLPFKIKDPHKILNTSYTMMVERELREMDPPILSSDFEAPDLIFGQKRVIPVNDVNAYKEMEIKPTSGSYQNFMNSMQGQMTSFANGGFSQMAPSKQPRAAREIVALENLKQQSLGNALVMYYNMIHQELYLRLKTMLQFYSLEKYSNATDSVLRMFTVGEMPLSTGGVGNVDVRLVRETSDPMKLYFEAVQRSIQTGKKTEIMEASIEFIENLEFFIDTVKLEPEKPSELERSLYVEQVLTPMLKTFIPAGIGDIGKTYLRWLEKMGETPTDYTADSTLQGLMGGRAPAMPPTGNQTGNMMQSQRGMMFGGQSSLPVPQEG